jgi:hypothetical protein
MLDSLRIPEGLLAGQRTTSRTFRSRKATTIRRAWTSYTLPRARDALLAAPFPTFTFSPAGASVYQFGNFGTAAKQLYCFKLT